MKHGVAFRGLSRTSSHRMLMLRNLVTSLFEHERIKTTFPKAQEAARLAEKMITLAKRGDVPSHSRASSFVLKPQLLPKLFTTFAERYADRPGGYTRIHKYGRRPGDNAPAALLELVDNPQDVRFALTARAVGRETLALKLGESTLRRSIREGVPEVQAVVDKELDVHYKRKGWLNGMTRLNMQKVLRYRGEGAKEELVQQAKEHADRLLAKPIAYLNVGKTEATPEEDEDVDSGKPSRATRRLDRPGAKAEWFGGRPAPGALGITALREKGQDPSRMVKGPFIKPKKVPRWLLAKPGFAMRPKLGVAAASAEA